MSQMRSAPATENTPVFSRYSRLVDPLGVGLLASTLSVIGAGNPSFWYDEAATISAAGRTVPALIKLIRTSDAAHPFFYFLMHGWFRVFPPTEFWARVPSCIAVGVAAAGLVILAKLLSTRTVALTGGVLFAILPRVTWAGIEARPYALTCVATVWLTIVLLFALRRHSVWAWVLYTALFTLSVLLNINLALMILVHMCYLMIIRAARLTWISWFFASCVAFGVLAPYLLFLKGQSTQLDWIRPLDSSTAADLLVNQYFDLSVPTAVLAGILMFLSVVVSHFRKDRQKITQNKDIVQLSLAWIIIPTTIILVVSAIAQPLYVDRYLAFTAPALALLLGVCVVVIGQKPVGVALLIIALTAAAAPNYLRQRSDYAKSGMDYSAAADLIAAHSSPGDCLLLDDTVDWQPGPIRPLVQARPAAYETLVDVGDGRSAISMGTLWDENLAPYRVSDRIATCTTIWTISQKDPALPAHEVGVALPPGSRFATANAFWVPRELGFRLVERWQFNLSQVTKAVR